MPVPPRDKLPPPPTVPGLVLMRCVSGSHAYGMDTPESDIDIRGVFVPERVYLLGCTKHVEQVEAKPDTVMYALQKYMALCRNANPNILELLFLPEDCILETHPIYQLLHDARNVFLSRKVRFTYSGYAVSQLKRIRTHRRWLLDPPKEPPKRGNFGLPEGESLISREQVGAFYVTLAHVLRDVAELELQLVHDRVLEILRSEAFPGWEGLIQRGGIPPEALPAVQQLTGASDNFIEVLQHEQSFYAAVNEWKRYNEWKRTRNPARAALEAKYGFDVKHASHLVRLMLQGESLMQTGTLTVRLPNAADIRRIRSGIWLDGTPVQYEVVEEFAQTAEKRMQELYESKDCPLAKVADANRIDQLCMELIERAWSTV